MRRSLEANAQNPLDDYRLISNAGEDGVHGEFGAI